jgi:hypothetical protein
MMPEIGSARKNDRVMLLATIVLVGTTVSMGYHYLLGAYYNRGYPYNGFLFRPWDHFNDFYNVYRWVDVFNTHGPVYGVQYTPFAHVLMTGARVLPDWVGLALVAALFLTSMIFLVWRFYVDGLDGASAKVRTAAILVALSYPVIYTLDRGNLEMLVFPFLVGFFYWYYLHPSDRRWPAYVCLAAAVCLKMYPATLLLLPLSDRRYRDFAGLVLGVAGLAGASTFVLGLIDGYGFIGTAQRALTAVQGGQSQWYDGVRFAHTAWGALGVLIARYAPNETWLSLAGPYMAFAVCAFLAVAAYVVFVETEPWRKAAMLMLAALVLPYVSADYTLIHLYPVIAVFLAAGGLTRLRGRTYAALFATLLIPLDYRWFEYARFGKGLPVGVTTEVSSSVVLYPAIMLVIMGLIVWDGFRARKAAMA